MDNTKVHTINPSYGKLDFYLRMVQTAVIRLFSASGTILLSILLARVLSKPEFGIMMVSLLSLTTLSMLARYGTDSSLLRFGGAASSDPDSYEIKLRGFGSWAFSKTIKNSIFLAVATFAGSYFLKSTMQLDLNICFWFCMALLPWSLIYTVSFILKANHMPSMGSVFEAGTVSQLTALWIFVRFLLGKTITGAIVAQCIFIISVVVLFIGTLVLWKFDVFPKRTNRIEADRIAFQRYCRDNILISVFQLFANWGAVFYLYFLWGPIATAEFSGPARFATLTTLLANIVLLVISPKIAGCYAGGDWLGYDAVVKRGASAIYLTTLPVLMVLIFGSPWIVTLLGASYSETWVILSILAFGQAIGVFASLGPSVVLMTGHERELRSASFVTVVSCISLTALLCTFWGAIGAAIGTAIYQAAQNWVAAYIAMNRLGCWPVAFSRGLKSSHAKALKSCESA